MRRWFLLSALFKHEIDVATKADFPLTVCLAEWQSNLGVRAIGRMSVASSNLPPQSRWTALRQLARGPANRLSARLRLRNLSAGAAFQLSLEVAYAKAASTSTTNVLSQPASSLTNFATSPDMPKLISVD